MPSDITRVRDESVLIAMRRRSSRCGDAHRDAATLCDAAAHRGPRCAAATLIADGGALRRTRDRPQHSLPRTAVRGANRRIAAKECQLPRGPVIVRVEPHHELRHDVPKGPGGADVRESHGRSPATEADSDRQLSELRLSPSPAVVGRVATGGSRGHEVGRNSRSGETRRRATGDWPTGDATGDSDRRLATGDSDSDSR